jgi:chromosomal replication initiator protein
MTPATAQRLAARLDRVEQLLGIDPTVPVLTADELRGPRVGAIMKVVAYEMGVRATAICGPNRSVPLTRARFAICWLARHLTPMSYAQIGIVLGGRDHTTIIHAEQRGAGLRVTDPAFRMLTDRLVLHFQPKED